MENNRETKALTTPLGKELVLKTYLTMGERRRVRDVFNTAADAEKTERVENALIKECVVSYDGVNAGEKNVVAVLAELDEREGNFVVASCLELTPEDPKKPRT